MDVTVAFETGVAVSGTVSGVAETAVRLAVCSWPAVDYCCCCCCWGKTAVVVDLIQMMEKEEESSSSMIHRLQGSVQSQLSDVGSPPSVPRLMLCTIKNHLLIL